MMLGQSNSPQGGHASSSIPLLSVVFLLVSCSSAPCPDGFSRDSSGNCIEDPDELGNVNLTGIWEIEFTSGSAYSEGTNALCQDNGTTYDCPGDYCDFFCNAPSGASHNVYLVHEGSELSGCCDLIPYDNIDDWMVIGTVDGTSVSLDYYYGGEYDCPESIAANGEITDTKTVIFSQYFSESTWCYPGGGLPAGAAVEGTPDAADLVAAG